MRIIAPLRCTSVLCLPQDISSLSIFIHIYNAALVLLIGFTEQNCVCFLTFMKTLTAIIRHNEPITGMFIPISMYISHGWYHDEDHDILQFLQFLPIVWTFLKCRLLSPVAWNSLSCRWQTVIQLFGRVWANHLNANPQNVKYI